MVQPVDLEDCRFHNHSPFCALKLFQYEHERRQFAQDLIDFDKEFATLFSGKPRTAENEDGISPEQVMR